MNNKQKKLKEDLAQLAAEAETDHELQMARSQLYKTAKYAIKLHEMLKGSVDLEAWQASKITKASDYLSSVFHSIDYDMSPASADLQIGSKIDTPESRAYSASLHKKLEEMKHTMEPAGVGHFKIVKKPTGFRVIVGLSAEGLTSKNAEHLSGDLKPNQIKREIDSVKRQLNLKDMKPYDENTQKILNKL